MSGVSLTPAQETVLRKYAQSVVEAPRHLSLTATRDGEEFWSRHVLDALALLETVPASLRSGPARVLDVGSGNGIPGIPIAVIIPEWTINLLDSNSKKCGFIDTFCKIESIKNVHVIAARAEDIGHQSSQRSSYDIVFARALGKLPVALELSAPFLKNGGLLFVPHGTSWDSELASSKKAMKELAVEIISESRYGDGFVAIIFKKIGDTPSKYPRAVGIPTKRPL